MEYDLKVLKINKNKIEQLNELSIYTVKDLVQHYPYRFFIYFFKLFYIIKT